MNFDEKIETQIEALGVSFYGFLKIGCLYFNDFDNEFITIDEGIKKYYDYYASKEKISEYVKIPSSLTESVEADTKFFVSASKDGVVQIG